jgi:hypothetical protein
LNCLVLGARYFLNELYLDGVCNLAVFD